MSTVSAAVGERSRKFHSLVLQRLASVGQVSVSEQIGVSESTVSRFVVNDIERACQLLAAVGVEGCSCRDAVLSARRDRSNLYSRQVQHEQAGYRRTTSIRLNQELYESD